MDPDQIILLIETLKWPIVVLIIIIIVIILFRSNISRFFNRIQKVNTPIGQFETPSINPPSELQSDPKKPRPLFEVLDNVLVQKLEEKIRNDPIYIAENDLNEKINGLVRHLAIAQIRLEFEKYYRLIWGSQIVALRHLASVHAPVDVNVLRVSELSP